MVPYTVVHRNAGNDKWRMRAVRNCLSDYFVRCEACLHGKDYCKDYTIWLFEGTRVLYPPGRRAHPRARRWPSGLTVTWQCPGLPGPVSYRVSVAKPTWCYGKVKHEVEMLQFSSRTKQI